MHARIIAAEASLLMPSSPRNTEAEEISRLIHEARRARNDAIAARYSALFRGLRKVLSHWLARRETISKLNSLSDRELADIGLSRGGIPAAAQASLPSPANDLAEFRRAA